jgi:hypothetical protein
MVVRKSDGLVRTSMPDGSTQYLPIEKAREVIAERFAKQTACCLEYARKALGFTKEEQP